VWECADGQTDKTAARRRAIDPPIGLLSRRRAAVLSVCPRIATERTNLLHTAAKELTGLVQFCGGSANCP